MTRVDGTERFSAGALPIDPDDLAKCVACGLCLPHCPTFRVSGEERLSPRGRIAAMRAVDAGAPIDTPFEEIMTTCVQCRACETACPSAVPFGRMMEATRSVIADRTVLTWQRLGYGVLPRHRLLQALTAVGGLLQRLRVLPRRLESRLSLPSLPLRQHPLVATGTDVWLFTGCVMDAWQRPVHRSAIAVLGAAGFGVRLPGADAACCGSLHAHAGLHDQAVRLAGKVISAFPGEASILVDSAGCGAAMKEYGQLIGTPAAQRFSSRVFDIHEWLAERSDRLPPPVPGWPRSRVAVQDPCHLRHVQKVDGAVRAILFRYADVVELEDDGRCCGAGGAYSALQPDLAGAIRSQKVAVIDAAKAELVASANPGCSMWLAAAGVPVRHPIEIISQAAGLGSG